MNQNHLFECQNGESRRAWLQELHHPSRPALKRFKRRIIKIVDFVTYWIAASIAVAIVMAVFHYARWGAE